jgi:ERCC4-type nuclease
MSIQQLKLKLRLVVDNRERGLIKALREQGFTNFKIQSLDLCDIAFLREDNSMHTGLERKTLPDLAASRVDNRWASQKPRLIAAKASGSQIGLVMEMPVRHRAFMNESCMLVPFRPTSLPASVLRGMLRNAKERDSLDVYWTASTEETATFVRAFFEETLENLQLSESTAPSLAPVTTTTSTSTSTSTSTTTSNDETTNKHKHKQEQLSIVAHKKRKSDNATPETRFADQLMAARCVGQANALAIARHFKSMALLVAHLEPLAKERDSLTDAVVAKRASKLFEGVDGIGPHKAMAILEALYGPK